MVGLMKQCLYKTVGKANLSWQELEEVLLDVEITLNNRPLSYLEDDIQFPALTPNTLAFGEIYIQFGGRHYHVRGGSVKKSEVCQEVQGYRMEQMEGRIFKIITRTTQHEM